MMQIGHNHPVDIDQVHKHQPAGQYRQTGKIPFHGTRNQYEKRHNEIAESNNELIVFITPYVTEDPNVSLPETIEEFREASGKLESVLEVLNETIEEHE